MNRRTAARHLLVPACLAVALLAVAGTTPAATRADGPDAAIAAPEMVKHPLGEVPADDPRMEAYSHGNYILHLAHFLWTAGILGLIVFSGSGATLQAWAERLTRSPNLKVAFYTALLTAVSFVT